MLVCEFPFLSGLRRELGDYFPINSLFSFPGMMKAHVLSPLAVVRLYLLLQYQKRDLFLNKLAEVNLGGSNL